MSENNFPQFMIAGTNSGSGKTTLTLGILRALTRRGLQCAPFKCGPDYIDPLFHRQAANRAGVNLDTFFGSQKSYARELGNADCAVTEGVMGLFDGIAPDSIRGSSAEIAAELNLPVILTVNARGISGSVAPLVKGFAEWRPEIRIAGVIANNIGSERHAELLKQALNSAGLPPLIGHLLRNERWVLPERHLGLSVGRLDPEWLDALAEEVERTIDLDLLLAMTRTERPACKPHAAPAKHHLRLGVASDEAFCFYYEENFRLLREHGVEIVPFSPLHDSVLPGNLNGLYLGGGYPELHAKELSANDSMRDAIRAFARDHLVYGECGGYLYLLESVSGFDGIVHPMLNLLPGKAKMNRKLAALGYREAIGEWGKIRGHEFHYSSLEAPPEGPALWRTEDAHGRKASAGSVHGHVKGSYIHLHFASGADVLKNLLKELES